MFNSFKNSYNLQNTFKSCYSHFNANKSFNYFSKKGLKLSQLHFYAGAGQNAPSGMKLCVIGGTANIGAQLAGFFAPRGTPVVMVHRGSCDIICPTGDDALYTKSNPYYSLTPAYMQYDLQNEVLIKLYFYILGSWLYEVLD